MDYKDYSQTVKHFKHVYPFADRDWKYSRDLGDLKRIVYDYDHDKFSARLKRAFRVFLPDRPDSGLAFMNPKGWTRFRAFKWRLERDKNLPDGKIMNASIITHWEEEGEYIQLVSPAVGDILVEWLENDSENIYAQRVVEKMKTILDEYLERAKALNNA